MSFKIGYSFPDEQTVEIFSKKGLELIPLSVPWNDDDEAVRQLQGMDCWVNCGQNCSSDMVSRLPNSIKMICRSGIGYDQIDVAAAEKRGICVSNTAGSMNASVSTVALILILETMRKTYLFNRRFMDGANFDRTGIVGRDLENKTVGLIGFGGIGRRLAQYLIGFHCEILVYDVYTDVSAVEEYKVKYVSLSELAERSDVVSVHCPLTRDSKHIVNAEFFGKMKKTAVLINTARGPVVDEAAMIDALKRGEIAGAGLDVYEQEPPRADNGLFALDNVYALPHIGSASVESRRLTTEYAVENIIDFINGKIPRNCVNRNYIGVKRG